MSVPLTEPRALGRDPFIDALRGGSVLMIVCAHWLSSVVRWTTDGYVGVTTVQQQVPLLSIASWVFVSTPVIFLVGGFSTARILTAGVSDNEFRRRRARRLLRPLLPFLGFWMCVEVLLHLAHPDRSRIFLGVSSRNLMPFGPLWFLGVYLVITWLAPQTHRLHRRLGPVVPWAMVGVVACADLCRLALHVPGVAWVNTLVVWSLPHHLGYFLADGRLRAKHVPVLLASAGGAALVLLAAVCHYPASVGGVPGDRFSNMAPPTLFIAALSVWQVGLYLLLERPIRTLIRFADGRRLVARLSSLSMSLFLWHMTGLCIFLVLARELGLTLAERPQNVSEWLAQRPGLFAGAGLVLVVIVHLVGRVETTR